jgi:hypothetical protein
VKKKRSKRVNRTAPIMVRLRLDERAKFLAAAKTKGLALSAWLRMVALEALEKKTEA